MTFTTITRGEAVHAVAGHLADCDSFVLVGIPPDALGTLIDCLQGVPAWAAYVDDGSGFALRTSDAFVLAVAGVLADVAVVVTVPKSVPAGVLGAALGEHVPADGSQDVIVLQSPDSPIHWPMIFVDALAVVDPAAAASLRLADVALVN